MFRPSDPVTLALILKLRRHSAGFSLVEILLALVILSGAIVGLQGSLQAALNLDIQSRFEARASMWAEREMEVLKTDLLAGARQAGRGGSSPGRFRLPKPWRTTLLWTAPDPCGAVRLSIGVTQADRTFHLESFVFIPGNRS